MNSRETRGRGPARITVLTLAIALAGCTGYGPSGSYGMPSGGFLRGGRALATTGRGFMLARPTDPTRFGAPTLIGALDRALARVAIRFPGTPPMRIGDLSYERGGKHPRHGSHRSGRDVDVIFHAVDVAGIPVPGSGFRSYDRFGVARPGAPSLEASGEGGGSPEIAPAPSVAPAAQPSDSEPVLFDVARNWHFVRSLVLDDQSLVQWIFCSNGIKALLLRYAIANEPNPDALVRAASVLHQPSVGRPHDDHFHIRVMCSADEQVGGCTDYGPVWPWLRDRVEKLGPGDVEALDDATLVHLLLDELPPLAGGES